MFLFGRQVEGLKGIRGEAIDRDYPRRADCTRALLHLARPRLSSNAQNQLGAFRHVAATAGRHRVLLMGPYGAGASSWLRQIAEEMEPSDLARHSRAVVGPRATLGPDVRAAALARR